MKKLKEILAQNPKTKQFILWLMQPKNRPRPRPWLRLINLFYHKKDAGSFISSNTRMDVFPYNKFNLGGNSIIENFSCINNALGNVLIGSNSRIGLSNTIIGPVRIGNNVNIAQNVVISGLNHGYKDIRIAPRLQPCTTKPIIIKDDCWIGANSVITSGVKIGKHCVIAAGSIVTKSIPPYSIVAGNPARIIKQYSFTEKEWIPINTLKKFKNEKAA